MSRWNLAWLIGLPAVIVVGLTVVFAAPRSPRPKDQDYEMVQGEPGTPITLTVARKGTKESLDLSMKRAKIEFPSVMGDLRQADDPAQWDYMYDKANKIAYVRLIAFNEHSAGDLKKAVEKL